MSQNFHAVRAKLVVEPYGHPEKFGSIYFPEAYKDGEPQFGRVLSCGPEVLAVGIQPGHDVLYRPYKAEPLKVSFWGTSSIDLRDVQAFVIGRELYPLPDFVLLIPDFRRKQQERLTSSIIVLPDVEHDDSYSPCLYGTVVRRGRDCMHVTPGRTVIMPPDKGVEIDFIDTRYYSIREVDLLGELVE